MIVLNGGSYYPESKKIDREWIPHVSKEDLIGFVPAATIRSEEEYLIFFRNQMAHYGLTNVYNNQWMDDPSQYAIDGSYSLGSASVGDIVYYGDGDHSGIVISISGGMIRVESKWGYLGVFTHNIDDCPFTMNASYTFWD